MADRGGLIPGARRAKEDVNYRQHEKCLACDYFIPTGTCELVAGNVSPENVCNLWEIKSQGPKYRDKEFFEVELAKQKKLEGEF